MRVAIVVIATAAIHHSNTVPVGIVEKLIVKIVAVVVVVFHGIIVNSIIIVMIVMIFIIRNKQHRTFGFMTEQQRFDTPPHPFIHICVIPYRMWVKVRNRFIGRDFWCHQGLMMPTAPWKH